MSSEASADAARHGALDLRRRKLLARIASGAGLASALSACGGGGPDDDASLRAVNATMDVASIDVQFNAWLFAGVEPPWSPPMARSTSPAATSAALPDDEPPAE